MQFLAAGQHDGLGTTWQKEARVLEIYLRGDEVVGVHVRRIVCKVGKTAEGTYHGLRDDLLQQVLQPDVAERVGADDGNLRGYDAVSVRSVGRGLLCFHVLRAI